MQDSDANLERQIEYYLRKYELNPHSRAFAPLADLYRKTGRVEEALEILAAGLAEHPTYVSALVIKARSHLALGQTQPALAAFQRVLELDPDNLVAIKQLADIALADGDQSRAASFLARVVSLDPTDERAAAQLEWLRGAAATAAAGPAATTPAEVAPAEAAPAEVAPAAMEPTEAAPQAVGRESASPVPEEPEPARAAAEATVSVGPAIGPSGRIEEAGAPVEPPAPPAPSPAAPGDSAGAEPTVAATVASAGPVEPSAGPVEPGAGPVEAGAGPAPGPLTDDQRRERQSFATKTLAEIYLAQGYRDKALAVLREILARHPERADVREKIAELAGAPEGGPAPAGRPETQAGGAPESHQHFEAWLDRLTKAKDRE